MKGETIMARNMVTRTVKGTEVTVKVVDAATDAISTEKVLLSKPYKDDAKLKKAVAKAVPEGKILIAVLSTEQVNKCYGVSTSKFMELAVELDPETRRAVEAEEAAENEAE